MATLSTNTAVTVGSLKTIARTLLRQLAALRPTPKTTEEHLAAATRRAEARARVDHLMR